MRVALDTNWLYTGAAGSARYIRGLIRGFGRIQRPDFQWFPLAWEVENLGYRQPARALKTAYRELFWIPWIAPRAMRRQGADLLHSTLNWYIRPLPGMRHVMTLQDVAFLAFPERFRKWQRASWAWRVRKAAGADRIICISRFTAQECHRRIGLDLGKTEVVYVGTDFHPEETAAAEQPPPAPAPSEFFLFVGSLEPGKNLALVKAAYQEAAERGVVLPPLLIVGARWEGVAREGPPPAGWRYLGRQPDPVLVFLYRRALALLFPSRYEGFGLPIAEAMALGCPVICSRVASLPEVAGDAALYAEQTPASYLEAMRRILAEPNLRDQCARRGVERSKQFSWKRCAEETIAVYQAAYS